MPPSPAPPSTDEAAHAERLRMLLARVDDPDDPAGSEALAVAVLQWARARTAAAARESP